MYIQVIMFDVYSDLYLRTFMWLLLVFRWWPLKRLKTGSSTPLTWPRWGMCRESSKFWIFTICHNLTKVRNTEDAAGDIHNLTYFPLPRIWKLINKAERAILQSDFDQSQWKLTTFTFSESSSDFHLILLIFIGLFNLTLSLPENWF